MKTEFFVINNDDLVATSYLHETLGRVVVLKGNIDLEFPLEFFPANGGEVVNIDIKEFLLKTLSSSEAKNV